MLNWHVVNRDFADTFYQQVSDTLLPEAYVMRRILGQKVSWKKAAMYHDHVTPMIWDEHVARFQDISKTGWSSLHEHFVSDDGRLPFDRITFTHDEGDGLRVVVVDCTDQYHPHGMGVGWAVFIQNHDEYLVLLAVEMNLILLTKDVYILSTSASYDDDIPPSKYEKHGLGCVFKKLEIARRFFVTTDENYYEDVQPIPQMWGPHDLDIDDV